MTPERSRLVLTNPPADVHVAGDELGRTYTPTSLAMAIAGWLVPVVAQFAHGRAGSVVRLLEPCLGGGAIVQAFRSVVGATGAALWAYGVDLDPKAPGRSVIDDGVTGDALRSPWPDHNGRGYYFDVACTNPPFGEEVGQEVTLGIVRAMRRAARVCAVLLPADYLTQTGYDAELSECYAVVRVVGRPFPVERGMVLYVWLQGHTGGIKVVGGLRNAGPWR